MKKVLRSGGVVAYDFEYFDHLDPTRRDNTWVAPKWLRGIVGEHVCADVLGVNYMFATAKPNDGMLAELKTLSDLRSLTARIGGFPVEEGFEDGRSDVTDEGLKCLRYWPRLTCLALDGSKVTDKGLEQLRHCPRLHSLSFCQCEITDEGLEYLHELRNLQQLYLMHTAVSANGVSRLRRELPTCQVFFADADHTP